MSAVPVSISRSPAGSEDGAGTRSLWAPANFGMTSRAKSRRLSSTCSCETTSAALSTKLMPSTPIDSHRLITDTR